MFSSSYFLLFFFFFFFGHPDLLLHGFCLNRLLPITTGNYKCGVPITPSSRLSVANSPKKWPALSGPICHESKSCIFRWQTGDKWKRALTENWKKTWWTQKAAVFPFLFFYKTGLYGKKLVVLKKKIEIEIPFHWNAEQRRDTVLVNEKSAKTFSFLFLFFWK